MKTINENSLAAIEFGMSWKSEVGIHRDTYLAERLNMYRDLLPEKIYEALLGSPAGTKKLFPMAPGSVTPSYESNEIFPLKQSQFERRSVNGKKIEPRSGRYYPKGLLKDVSNVFQANVAPFRCVDVDPAEIIVDFNHPLAGKPFDLDVSVHKVRDKPVDRGGSLTDWMEVIADGPGMQVRANGKPTDFFSDDAFIREDSQEDSVFYERPRLVTHIDEKALKTIGNLYGSLLKPKTRVLDLMSSWRSHVPKSLELDDLVGLGLNAKEMKENPRLTSHVVHDLNITPRLPFDDDSFDSVICTVSVEYMTKPFEVFKDVARVLKPGGLFIHTFSNRWFQPKAISIWTELNEFERMGVVLEYFLQTDSYEKLETFSARGGSRPVTDRHYPEILTSDPVYAVWGRVAK